MQLTLHSDYALRVLLYLACHPGKGISTRKISQAYGISQHHLVRVIQRLNEVGYVTIASGRYGGAKLARDPEQVGLGDVVRATELNLALVECFDQKTNTCVISPVCGLKGVLQSALQEFLSVLDRYTLADLVTGNGMQRIARVFARKATKTPQ
jgi:Rrf2 family nitric oxide-sensitive transcriptional repressor